MTREEAIKVQKWLQDNLFAYNNVTESTNMAIEALEQQPCKDCISREAVNEGFKKYDRSSFAYGCVWGYVNKLPSVTPKEKTGHWIENAPEYQNIDPPYICSECGNMHLRKTNYCDQCGARMIEPQESKVSK